MCDFYSTCWRMQNGRPQMIHASHNSHSKMIEECGWPINRPNRQTVIFEAEWGFKAAPPQAAEITRNSAEAASSLLGAIDRHYALIWRMLSGEVDLLYTKFGNTKTYGDLWSEMLKRGYDLEFPSIFEGNLDMRGCTSMTGLPESLTQIGDLDMSYCTSMTGLPESLNVSGSIFR